MHFSKNTEISAGAQLWVQLGAVVGLLLSMSTNYTRGLQTSCCQQSERFDVQRRHEQVKKPVCISDYNMFMNVVDRADQYLSYYSLLRKTVKWTK
jgi:hypothetical protein